MSTKFHLCAILEHRKGTDVQSVTETDGEEIITCGSQGACTIWGNDGSSREISPNLHGQNALVFCISRAKFFGPADGTELFVSGGSDGTVNVWDKKGAIVGRMNGHTGAITSISSLNGLIITGSFDKTAKVWKDYKCVATLKGEHVYGVKTCGLDNGDIVTGSFENVIIWRDYKVFKIIQKAHGHAVKKIVKHPKGFATCSNDGYVKLWNEQGDLLWKILAHPAEGATPSFIYSLSVNWDTEEIASAGENKRCCIWDKDGNKVEEIAHPFYIKEVIYLKNSDIVTTNGDFAFVFSRNKERIASGDVSKKFQKIFIESGNKQEKDTNQLEHTVHVEFDDGRKIPLKFNRNDDPKKAASLFSLKHGLSEQHESEITKYLSKLAVNNKKENFQSDINFSAKGVKEGDPKNLKTLPVWRCDTASNSFKVHFAFNCKMMVQKIGEFNSKISQNDELKTKALLSEKELTKLSEVLNGTSQFHVADFDKDLFSVFKKMLLWPQENLFPALDALRVVSCHSRGVQLMCSGLKENLLLLEVSRLISSNMPLDVLCLGLSAEFYLNFIAKMPKNRFSERIEGEIRSLICQNMLKFMERKVEANEKHKKRYFLSVLDLLYNFLKWNSNNKMADEEVKKVYETMWNWVSGKILYFSTVSLNALKTAAEVQGSLYIALGLSKGIESKEELHKTLSFLLERDGHDYEICSKLIGDLSDLSK